jgi:hypothetical protein
MLRVEGVKSKPLVQTLYQLQCLQLFSLAKWKVHIHMNLTKNTDKNHHHLIINNENTYCQFYSTAKHRTCAQPLMPKQKIENQLLLTTEISSQLLTEQLLVTFLD